MVDGRYGCLDRRSVQDGRRFDVLSTQRLHILDFGESAETGDIADDAEIHRHHAKVPVGIFHDKNGFAGIRQILAVILVFPGARQVDLEELCKNRS